MYDIYNYIIFLDGSFIKCFTYILKKEVYNLDYQCLKNMLSYKPYWINILKE